MPVEQPQAAPSAPASPAPAGNEAPPVGSVVQQPAAQVAVEDPDAVFDDGDLPNAGELVAERRLARLESRLGTNQTAAADTSPESKEETPAVKPEEKAPELILGRFKTWDDVAEAYRNLEGDHTRKSQMLAAVEKELGTSDPKVQGQMKQVWDWYVNQYWPQFVQSQQGGKEQGKAAPQGQEQPTAAPQSLLAMDREQLLDKLTEDPKGVLQGLVAEAIKTNPQLLYEAMGQQPEMIERLVPELRMARIQDSLWKEFTALQQEHPDAEEFLPAMKDLLAKNPKFREKSLEDIYDKARSLALDEFKAKHAEAVKNAATMATEAAYQNQNLKKQAGIEGAKSTEPGGAPPKDAEDQFFEWEERQHVRA